MFFKLKKKGIDEKEADVSRYWMALRKTYDTGILSKLWFALCGELALQDGIDMS